MNLLHLKYAVEVAKTGSINKAAENLLIAQPNLSRSIKELENELKITIFDRSSRGMVLTQDGEEFIESASQILSQVDYVEKKYKDGLPHKTRFSICVPRASYLSNAFSAFSKSIPAEPAELIYKETNSLRTLKSILSADYRLGILRYAVDYEKYFMEYFESKKLAHELITEFEHILVFSRQSPLAKLKNISASDLREKIEIAHADPYVPYLPISDIRKDELLDDANRRIYVFERASQFELLSENPETYMYVSALPEKTLKRYDLIQTKVNIGRRKYKDVLIYKNDYRLSDLDKKFIEEVKKSKKEILDRV